MSNARYIEVNSNYRDRKLWPLASEFEIPISQTGTNNITTSVDPVSLSTPVFSWTSNNLIIGGGTTIPSGGNTAIISTPFTTNNIPYSSDGNTFMITTSDRVQELRNYYNSLIIKDTSNSSSVNPIRRILYSYYLGQDSTGKYRTQITVTS